ncbi:hypothetical protein ACJMK2_034660 [Sinanodonta woodiana]|uniref:IQ domain-containing protein K n=1 Tax=Sinanodonta woodiana TaxID=1069815 RepID=A0ABD3WVT0_SINWO
MSVITKVPEPNLWETICKEFALQRPVFRDDDDISVNTDYQDYDPARHNPVFFGKMYHQVDVDANLFQDVNPANTHPSCIGYAFATKPPPSPPPPPTPPPDKDKCTPREYLEYYIFPYLLPALDEMLKQAKKEKCFERKRTKFNAMDFLAEYLYRHDPKATGRENIKLEEIPFVKEWLKDHPRPPLPLSLIWTEEEAACIIQSHWRGYLVRRDQEVQELRQWQREWREENCDISSRVNDFWGKKMPDYDKPTPNASEDQLNMGDRPISVKGPSKSASGQINKLKSPTQNNRDNSADKKK